MFVEALTPVGAGLTDAVRGSQAANHYLFDTMDSLYKIQNDENEKVEKTQNQMYRAETARMNAEAKIEAINYANRLADMAEQRGIHTANMAGQLNDMVYSGSPYQPVQVQIGPQPIAFQNERRQ